MKSLGIFVHEKEFSMTLDSALPKKEKVNCKKLYSKYVIESVPVWSFLLNLNRYFPTRPKYYLKDSLSGLRQVLTIENL